MNESSMISQVDPALSNAVVQTAPPSCSVGPLDFPYTGFVLTCNLWNELPRLLENHKVARVLCYKVCSQRMTSQAHVKSERHVTFMYVPVSESVSETCTWHHHTTRLQYRLAQHLCVHLLLRLFRNSQFGRCPLDVNVRRPRSIYSTPHITVWFTAKSGDCRAA